MEQLIAASFEDGFSGRRLLAVDNASEVSRRTPAIKFIL